MWSRPPRQTCEIWRVGVATLVGFYDARRRSRMEPLPSGGHPPPFPIRQRSELDRLDENGVEPSGRRGTLIFGALAAVVIMGAGDQP